MIPQFPDFKKITIDDRNILKEFTEKYPPYNDFDFVSLWTYNSRDENAYSFLNENLVIKMEDFITGNIFYSFLGTHKVKETIETLLTKCDEEKIEKKLRLIPEVCFENLSDLSQYFNIEEDIDSNDYVLSVEGFATLKRSDYKNKRKLLNKFNNKYPSCEIKELDLSDPIIQTQIETLYSKWKDQKGEYKFDTKMEYIAIHRLFAAINSLDVHAIGLYNESNLVGFSTYHVVQLGYSILSFHKADISFVGIYTLLNHEVAKKLQSLGVEYMNCEQDLGIEGLRNAKMLWKPIFFLKKFTVSELTSQPG